MLPHPAHTERTFHVKHTLGDAAWGPTERTDELTFHVKHTLLPPPVASEASCERRWCTVRDLPATIVDTRGGRPPVQRASTG